MLALVTGAGSGMGTEISRSLARAGYEVIMACRNMKQGLTAKEAILADTPGAVLDVREIDLSDLADVAAFADRLLAEGRHIDRLMNNAGTLDAKQKFTVNGLDNNISVNYVGPYLLTRKLLPLMGNGSRIVNMASMVYRIGRIDFPEFFTKGCRGSYNRFKVYSNSKLAITLFSLKLAGMVKDKGITVNASDPGIVSTNIIRMDNRVIDTLCDIFFRPVIYTPLQGASTAIDLLLNPQKASQTGTFNKRSHPVRLGSGYTSHPMTDELWNRTEEIVKKLL